LAGFHGTQDYTARRAIITAARHRGSMPPDVAAALGQAVEAGEIIHEQGEVVAAAPQMGGVRLALAGGDSLRADRVLLATGFDPARPGGPWLDAAIAAHGLPTAPDGYPIVDQTLAWAPGLHVSGPLAELEVGPAARNFVGARLAAERIAAGL
jgi:pyruvate/2-oxoglutarate dehydrogenase complex dihydrolipoamide dehydrogenase (E3) component